MSNSVEPRHSPPEPASARGEDAAPAPAPAPAHKAAGLHSASTRVTIAWPFSQIKLQEASAELTELAGLLGELVDALSDLVPEDRLAPLRERTEALQARLR